MCVCCPQFSERQKYEEAIIYYKAIASGNNFSDIQRALTQENVDLAAIYREFHRCLHLIFVWKMKI